MARPLRLEYEGAVYHVTSRGNAREDIFLHDDVWEELRAGALLGTDTFVEQMKSLLKEKLVDSEIRKEERFAARPPLEELFSGVSDKPTRNERIYQAVRIHQYMLREVGDFLGLHFWFLIVLSG